jgi:hypothetical protein
MRISKNLQTGDPFQAKKKAETMRVKIQKPEKEWGLIRQTIFWVFFCILLVIVSFEAGYLVKSFEKDNTREEVRKLNSWVVDHGGRIEALETIDGREKTGSGKPVNPDAERRRQGGTAK